MTFPTTLPSRDAVDPEARLVLSALADLHEPNRLRYWAELLLSALSGWTALLLAAGQSAGLLSLCLLVLATVALYRAVQFIHELEHLRPRAVPGLALAWTALIGLPFLLPRFMHGCHHAHHDGRTYGTLEDPEYSPMLGSTRMQELGFVLVAALAPLLLALRALVLAPVSYAVPPLRKWLLRRASTLGMNLAFERRDLESGQASRPWRLEEGLVSLSAWLWLWLCLRGAVEPRQLGMGLAVMSAVAMLDQLKTLVVHRFVGRGVRLSHGQQTLDAIDIAGGAWAEVWAPLHGRLHRMHHLAPALPYHALPEALARLERLLQRDSWLRRAEEPSLGAVLAWLRGPGVDPPSAVRALPRHRGTGALGRALGCLPDLARDFRGTLVRAFELHGPLAELRLPGRRIFALHDPAAAQLVLSTMRSSFSKETPGFRAMRAVMGRGLITVSDDEWLGNRKRVQSAFRLDALGAMRPRIEGVVEDHVGDWSRADPFDLAEAIYEVTLAVAADLLFSLDLRQHRSLCFDLRTIVSQGEDRLLTTAGAWLPTRKNRAWKAALRRVDAALFALLEERSSRPASGDLLDALIAAHPGDSRQIRDEAMTFLLAGHETTAMSALWTFVLASRFPDADISDPKQTMLESLRLMPPVWLLGRRAEQDVEICGYRVPRGSFVLISPWILQRRADLYPEPERFDPTRFSACPPKYGFIPFGAGPRRCIGDDLALMVLDCILAAVRVRGRLEVLDPWAIPEVAGITVRPRVPVRARWVIRPSASGRDFVIMDECLPSICSRS